MVRPIYAADQAYLASFRSDHTDIILTSTYYLIIVIVPKCGFDPSRFQIDSCADYAYFQPSSSFFLFGSEIGVQCKKVQGRYIAPSPLQYSKPLMGQKV